MIRKYEEISMNAFIPEKTVIYDGWLLRMSSGTSKRLNSVNMLYPSSLSLEEKLTYCETLYTEAGHGKVFKITDLTSVEVIGLLRDKGYKDKGHTYVQVKQLNTSSDNPNIHVESNLSDAFLNGYCQLTKRHPSVYKRAWSDGIQERYFVSINIQEEIVAYGVGCRQGDVIGIYGILVHPDYRKRGYGRQITESIMAIGYEAGCKTAYLQVEKDNHAARALYESMGFETAYAYYYLVK